MAFKMYGKSPMMKALIGKQENLPEELKAKILASPDKMYGESPMKEVPSAAVEAAKRARVAGKPTPESKKAKVSSTKSGPDWSKAPKMNTQARRDWYTKNNLAQDKTTKLKSTAPEKVASKKVTKVEPKKTVPKVAKVAKVAKTKSRRELANERIAARRAKRKEKLKKFVRGLGPRSKAKK